MSEKLERGAWLAGTSLVGADFSPAGTTSRQRRPGMNATFNTTARYMNRVTRDSIITCVNLGLVPKIAISCVGIWAYGNHVALQILIGKNRLTSVPMPQRASEPAAEAATPADGPADRGAWGDGGRRRTRRRNAVRQSGHGGGGGIAALGGSAANERRGDRQSRRITCRGRQPTCRRTRRSCRVDRRPGRRWRLRGCSLSWPVMLYCTYGPHSTLRLSGSRWSCRTW